MYRLADYCDVKESVRTNFALFLLLRCKNRGHIFSCCEPLLQLFSNFCLIMYFRPFLLQLCSRGQPPLMPPRTTWRFWMRVHSRDWWESAVLKEFKWWRVGRKLLNAQRVFKKNKFPFPKMRRCVLGCHRGSKKNAQDPQFSKCDVYVS